VLEKYPGLFAIILPVKNKEKTPHLNPQASPRSSAIKPPHISLIPLPGSPGNRMEKVHGKSEERYTPGEAVGNPFTAQDASDKNRSKQPKGCLRRCI
jgi:hypothetical protein